MTKHHQPPHRTLVWLREDLRVCDNPALYHAAQSGAVLPVYVDDTTNTRPMGAASKVWLHHSLMHLQENLPLQIFKGDPKDIIPYLAQKHQIACVYWNRGYSPEIINRDKTIKQTLQNSGATVKSFNANLLVEPWAVTTGAGDFYKVFTPFWKACLKRFDTIKAPAEPLPATTKIEAIADDTSVPIQTLGLLPQNEGRWDETLFSHWQVGEAAAYNKLTAFCQASISDYNEARNRPDQSGTSQLSPHLHFGEISPKQVYHHVQQVLEAQSNAIKGAEVFLSEIGWREFCTNLIYHIPTLPEAPLQEKFKDFKWDDNPQALQKWQQGQTGYPIVDAGMRQLYQTGWMHNRVRMIVASFLIKDLFIHWKHGEEWFWDCLVDADMANNVAGWQWVAGSGADASPYFRIFNPITQGQKFDPNGDYVRQWLPELKDLPNDKIHAPWEAAQGDLKMAGIELGKDYPNPMVNHKAAREEALVRYKNIKA